MEEDSDFLDYIIFMTEGRSVSFDCCPLLDLNPFEPVALNSDLDLILKGNGLFRLILSCYFWLRLIQFWLLTDSIQSQNYSRTVGQIFLIYEHFSHNNILIIWKIKKYGHVVGGTLVLWSKEWLILNWSILCGAN